MEKVFLSIIAASALCAVSSNVKHQYHFVYEPKNQTEARSYCREKYTDLATIDNMEEMNILNNMANLSKMVYSTYKYVAWIGLYDDWNSWRWSLEDKMFYNDREAEFRNWAYGEPDNFRSEERCASFSQSGVWNDYPCTNAIPSVCFDVKRPNVTFFLINNNMTWTEAQSYCREHHTDLASIRNMEENQKLKEMVSTRERVWIGLYRDSWKWMDGSNSSFRYWNEETREPNNYLKTEACAIAYFNNNGKWEDFKCDFKNAFICYSPLTSKQVFRMRLKTNSSVDLNDPAVKEEMLQQIKQKLKEQGLNEDIKLSWRKQPDGKVFHKEKKKTTKRNTVKKKELQC